MKLLPEQERTEFFSLIEEEKEVTIRYSDDKCIIYGSQFFEAKIMIWNKFKDIVYFKSQVEFPPEWENMEAHNLGTKIQVFELDQEKHEKEYELVENTFMKENNFGGIVTKIERIQNIDLYENYSFARKRVLTKYHNKNLELTEDNPNRNKLYLF